MRKGIKQARVNISIGILQSFSFHVLDPCNIASVALLRTERPAYLHILYMPIAIKFFVNEIGVLIIVWITIALAVGM